MKFLKIFQETAKNTSYLLMFQDGAEAWKIIFFYGWSYVFVGYYCNCCFVTYW